MKRHEVKEIHENAVLKNFEEYCLSQGLTFNVSSQPDPPDAFVEVNGRKTWVEITDAFLNPELAESITSYVSNDKEHRPVPKEKRIIIDPEENFNQTLKNTILKKYTKNSIGKIYQNHGQGILLVGIFTPFSDAKEMAQTAKATIEEAIKPMQKRFKKIYFYNVNDSVFVDLNIETPKTVSQFKLNKMASLLFLSLVLSVFIFTEWANEFLSNVSSFLFTFFLPTVAPIILLFGAKENSNEFSIFIGIAIQCFVLYYVIKTIINKINA